MHVTAYEGETRNGHSDPLNSALPSINEISALSANEIRGTELKNLANQIRDISYVNSDLILANKQNYEIMKFLKKLSSIFDFGQQS